MRILTEGFFVENSKSENNCCNKGKRSLDFITSDSQNNQENNNLQLVPRGEDLDVSFVVPLDVSFDKSTEQSVAVTVTKNRLENVDKEYSCQLGDTMHSGGLNSEGRKRNYSEELSKTSSDGKLYQ